MRWEAERGPTAAGRSESPIFRYGGWGEPDPVFRTLQQLVEAVRRESIPFADSLQQRDEPALDRRGRLPLSVRQPRRLNLMLQPVDRALQQLDEHAQERNACVDAFHQGESCRLRLFALAGGDVVSGWVVERVKDGLERILSSCYLLK